jgi:hypothetical protein
MARKKLTPKATAQLRKSGIKHPAQYTALKAKGMSKERAAKISNASRKKR